MFMLYLPLQWVIMKLQAKPTIETLVLLKLCEYLL